MGKLIELLNEYENENKSDLYYKFELENGELYCYDDVTDVLWTMQDEAMVICSKKFGFIKWLVENEKVNPYDPSYNVPTHIALGVDDGDGDFMVYERFFKEEELLMLLSIQDEPINFLVSILK